MLIIFLCCRTLEVAKRVIKDKQHVYNKADDVITLSGDNKLQDVSSFFMLRRPVLLRILRTYFRWSFHLDFVMNFYPND